MFDTTISFFFYKRFVLNQGIRLQIFQPVKEDSVIFHAFQISASEEYFTLDITRPRG